MTWTKGWRRSMAAAWTRISGVSTTALGGPRRRRLVQYFATPRHQHHPRAGQAKRASDGQPDTRISAGHERHAPLQREKRRAPVHARVWPANSSAMMVAITAHSASSRPSGMRMSHSRSSARAVAGGVCGSLKKPHWAGALV